MSVANSASLKFSLVDGINLTWALLSTSSNNESKENSDVEYKKHEQHSKTGITVNSNEFNNSEGPYQISSVGNEKLLNEQNSIAKTCKDEEYFSTEEMNIRLRAYSEETGELNE